MQNPSYPGGGLLPPITRNTRLQVYTFTCLPRALSLSLVHAGTVVVVVFLLFRLTLGGQNNQLSYLTTYLSLQLSCQHPRPIHSSSYHGSHPRHLSASPLHSPPLPFKQLNKRTNKQTNEQTNKQTNSVRQTNKQTNNKQTGRQTRIQPPLRTQT